MAVAGEASQEVGALVESAVSAVDTEKAISVVAAPALEDPAVSAVAAVSLEEAEASAVAQPA